MHLQRAAGDWEEYAAVPVVSLGLQMFRSCCLHSVCPCATVNLGRFEDVANWLTSAGSKGHDLSVAEYSSRTQNCL